MDNPYCDLCFYFARNEIEHNSVNRTINLLTVGDSLCVLESIYYGWYFVNFRNGKYWEPHMQPGNMFYSDSHY